MVDDLNRGWNLKGPFTSPQQSTAGFIASIDKVLDRSLPAGNRFVFDLAGASDDVVAFLEGRLSRLDPASRQRVIVLPK